MSINNKIANEKYNRQLFNILFCFSGIKQIIEPQITIEKLKRMHRIPKIRSYHFDKK